MNLKIALRRVGLLGKDGIALSKTDSLSSETAIRLSGALKVISRSTELKLENLPFVCLQSVLAPVPPAVRMVQGFDDPVAAHLSAGALSFERVLVATSVLVDLLPAKAVAAIRVDAVCNRPVVMKANQLNPSMAASIVFRALEAKSQHAWQHRPSKRLSRALLAHRLAKLRVDIPEDLKKSAAVDVVTFSGQNGAAVSYDVMVARMNRLSYTELSRVNTARQTATYMIPFGATVSATPTDVAHSHFANHPVWMDALVRTVFEPRNMALTRGPATPFLSPASVRVWHALHFCVFATSRLKPAT